jgi:predicted exporter
MAMALTVAYWVFGRIHLLALVFGSSLIGVVIDYALHYLVDRFRNPGQWSAVDALEHIAPAILWGCIATACGYAGLTLVPLPGLQQIALFCFVGSLTGCVSVLCLFPVFARGGPPPARFILQWAQGLELWLRQLEQRRAFRMGVIVVVLAVAAGGLSRVTVQDDLRALQASAPRLAAVEQRVKEVLGTSIESGFFVVRGATEESLLEAQEQLAADLLQLVEREALTGFVAVSRAIPSLAMQQANGELLRERVLQTEGPYERVLRGYGYSAEAIKERRAASLQATQPLAFNEWLASPAAQPLRPFWLGKVGMQYASVVTVSGIRDLAAVARAGGAVSGVAWVDRVQRISSVLRDYRVVATWMWGAVCATILLVLTLRFGWRVALRAALPCMTATLLTLALFGWFGLPVNLFVVLAMFLVVGLGIDYGLVLMHSHAARSTGVISVTLSSFRRLALRCAWASLCLGYWRCCGA